MHYFNGTIFQNREGGPVIHFNPLKLNQMDTKQIKPGKNVRIVIIGAGPARLSTAWFLMKNGFKNVTVLEKLGRVGGLCKSITIGGASFDIGANYTTWAYKETLKIEHEVGATTHDEKPYTSIELNDNETNYTEEFSECNFIQFNHKEKNNTVSFCYCCGPLFTYQMEATQYY